MTKTPNDYKEESYEWNRRNQGAFSNEPVMELYRRIRWLEDSFPNFELMKKYPALQEAYKEYKTIETLILSGENDKEGK